MQTRQRDPELMDDPTLDHAKHMDARKGLARLNTLSGAAHSLYAPIKEYAGARGLTTIRVLDIAVGGADVPLRLWRIAKRDGIELLIDGCDVSQDAINCAKDKAQKMGAPSQFFKLNVLDDKIPSGYDVIMTSLFTHHLDEEQTVKLLHHMKDSTRGLLIVNDLERSQINYALVWLATRVVTLSPVVHFDGPVSVKASYTAAELAALAERAGLQGAVVKEAFPCRMMLLWKKS